MKKEKAELLEKLRVAEASGEPLEVSLEEAEMLGAFEESALSEEDALAAIEVHG